MKKIIESLNTIEQQIECHQIVYECKVAEWKTLTMEIKKLEEERNQMNARRDGIIGVILDKAKESVSDDQGGDDYYAEVAENGRDCLDE